MNQGKVVATSPGAGGPSVLLSWANVDCPGFAAPECGLCDSSLKPTWGPPAGAQTTLLWGGSCPGLRPNHFPNNGPCVPGDAGHTWAEQVPEGNREAWEGQPPPPRGTRYLSAPLSTLQLSCEGAFATSHSGTARASSPGWPTACLCPASTASQLDNPPTHLSTALEPGPRRPCAS